MLSAMAIAAALCIGIGSFPAWFYPLLPFKVDFVPYSLHHVVGQVQLLFLSALAFTLLMRTGIYPPELRSVNLDFDWFYRRVGRSRWPRRRRNMERPRAGRDALRLRARERRAPLSWTRRHSGPHLANRRDGVLDDHHARCLSDPIVPMIGVWFRRLLPGEITCSQRPRQLCHGNLFGKVALIGITLHRPPRSPFPRPMRSCEVRVGSRTSGRAASGSHGTAMSD